MSTAYLVLGLLCGGARHGYEIKRAHDTRMPQARPLAFGQVYATLGRLERDGLIEAVRHEQEGGPERTAFELTRKGRTALAEWLSDVEAPMPHVTSALFTRVVVALLASGHEVARDYLVRQRAAHTQRIRELTRAKLEASSGGSAGSLLAADYAIAHLDADLRWLETTLERVVDLQKEVRE